MLSIQQAPMIKSASTGVHELDPGARAECEDIMEKIRAEDPSYWPYGLDIRGHDGGVWMVRQASTDKPVGFVGWQERRQGRSGITRSASFPSIVGTAWPRPRFPAC